MSNIRRIRHDGGLLHVETPLGVVSIQAGLADVSGRPVDSVQVMPDDNVARVGVANTRLIGKAARAAKRSRMKLVELLDIANRGYPDGFLAEYYDTIIGGPKRGSGDTLAEFIVKELTDTFDDEADGETQINDAVRALERAINDLAGTVAALNASCQSQGDGR